MIPEPIDTALLDQRLPLAGRDGELAQLHSLFSGPVRVITLTGPAGIGKTRLALRFAGELAEREPGTITVVPLASLRDPDLVLSTIAQALDLRGSDDAAILERMAIRFNERRHLLVLDGFERLIPSARVIADMLAAAAGLRILITSRETLRLSGEQEFPVQPLSVPSHRPVRADEAMQWSAMELFIQRARNVRPGFALAPGDADVVAEICARLDGIPLAIELAAVRTKILAPRALLARLANRLALLTGGPRDAPDRLRTMRDAIAWSVDLLDDQERIAFRRFGIFAGGGTLDAVEKVIGDADGTIAGVPVLELVASLIDKSLLLSEEGPGGEQRYRMLETIREFALDELAASGDVTAIERRHTDWMIAFAERAEPELYGTPHQLEWLAKLNCERDNLRAVLERTATQGDTASYARLVAAIWLYWFNTDTLREGRPSLQRALDLAPVLPEPLVMQLLVAQGFVVMTLGDFETARNVLTTARDIGERLDAPRWLGWSEFALGVIDQDLGEPAAAASRFRAALTSFQRVPGFPALVATANQNLGLVTSRLGDHAAGASLLRTAREQHRRANFAPGVAIASRFLGQVLRASGDDAGAALHYRQALDIDPALAQQWHIANAVEGLAAIAAKHQQEDLAAVLLGAIDRFRTQAGTPLEPALLPAHHATLAQLRSALGDAGFEDAWTRGRATPIDAAISLARRVTSETFSTPATTPPPPSLLSPRELEVLRLLVDGRSTSEIANLLYISPRTVGTHIANLLEKLEVNSRSAAVALALRRGLV